MRCSDSTWRILVTGSGFFEGMIRHHTGAIEMANKRSLTASIQGQLTWPRTSPRQRGVRLAQAAEATSCRLTFRPGMCGRRGRSTHRRVIHTPVPLSAADGHRLASIALSGDPQFAESGSSAPAWSATVIPRA
jgi:hypothetical protein